MVARSAVRPGDPSALRGCNENPGAGDLRLGNRMFALVARERIDGYAARENPKGSVYDYEIPTETGRTSLSVRSASGIDVPPGNTGGQRTDDYD